ncbi:DUF6615 family protein [Pantoea endophytica]|uniref:DUF6615 family protein n=1 Tax=Pantoea endophytica TaxID=92488 RepID=UPI003019DFA7
MSIFSQVSEKVWETLGLCLIHNINFGEETISDLILLEIERNNPGYIRTFQTSKADEKNKGTDWEWWIGDISSGWARYAVQAKKIDKKGKNYNALAHKVGKAKKYQHDILKQYCVANNAIGLYAFYNFHMANPQSHHWHCTQNYDDKRLGVTITPIKNVISSINTKGSRNFNSLHSHKDTLPLHCLLECLSAPNGNVDDRSFKTHKHFDVPRKHAGKDISEILEGIINNPNLRNELYDNDVGLPAKILVIDTKRK